MKFVALAGVVIVAGAIGDRFIGMFDEAESLFIFGVLIALVIGAGPGYSPFSPAVSTLAGNARRSWLVWDVWFRLARILIQYPRSTRI